MNRETGNIQTQEISLSPILKPSFVLFFVLHNLLTPPIGRVVSHRGEMWSYVYAKSSTKIVFDLQFSVKCFVDHCFSFSLQTLHCLAFDVRLLITPLVSSNQWWIMSKNSALPSGTNEHYSQARKVRGQEYELCLSLYFFRSRLFTKMIMKIFNCNISLWFFKSKFRSYIEKLVFLLK